MGNRFNPSFSEFTFDNSAPEPSAQSVVDALHTAGLLPPLLNDYRHDPSQLLDALHRLGSAGHILKGTEDGGFSVAPATPGIQTIHHGGGTEDGGYSALPITRGSEDPGYSEEEEDEQPETA